MQILDTNNDTTSKLSSLKADGVQTVIRYLSTNLSGEKVVKPAEARAIAAAGMNLALVFEIYGGVDNFVHNDITSVTGRSHGEFAKGYAPTVGAPDNTIIWFAIDTDVSSGQYTSLVKPYLLAVRAALAGKYRLGVYACGDSCQKALDQGVVDATWLTQSTGWNGSRAFKATNRWTLLQGPETTLHGLSVDSDVTNSPDYGAFVPFSGTVVIPVPPVVAVSNELWIQRELNKRGANPKLVEDGDIGPLSIAAIKKFIESTGAGNV